MFAPKDNEWLAKVDNVKTFDDVLILAKEMLDWQKEQVEQMKKLPDFDSVSVVKNYDLGDDEEEFEDSDNGQGDDTEAEKNDDDADEKNDFNNFGDQEADDEKDSNQSGQSNKSDEKKDESGGESDSYSKGAGGDDVKKKVLKAITDDAYTQKQESLLDDSNKGYRYGKIPTPNLKDGALTSFKTWLKDMNDYRIKQRKYCDISKYDNYLDKEYKKFMNGKQENCYVSC
tara:strand:- start:166 stop:852 length:687 start_codon:yes stop_codon:yes gene_type:complete